MNQARVLRAISAVAIMVGGGLLLAALAVGLSFGSDEPGLIAALALAGAVALVTAVVLGLRVRSAASCPACGKLFRAGTISHCPRCGAKEPQADTSDSPE